MNDLPHELSIPMQLLFISSEMMGARLFAKHHVLIIIFRLLLISEILKLN